jgi:iron-sulfur cluster assembly protein
MVVSGLKMGKEIASKEVAMETQNNGTQQLIALTERALEEIRAILLRESKPEGTGLRLGVIGGGCSGLSYKIDFGERKEKDNVIEFGELKVFIDLKSSIYLKGITLDYKDGLAGKGFIFVNPNANNTCGCGESFSV